MKPLKEEACKLLENLRKNGATVRLFHIPRKENARADELANEGLSIT